MKGLKILAVIACSMLIGFVGSSPVIVGAGCLVQWRVVSTPMDVTAGYLRGVAALSPREVWAVGIIHKYSDHDPNHPLQRPYVLHYPDCGRGDGR